MSLRNKLIKLAHEKPELRKDLLPLLKKAGGDMMTWLVQAAANHLMEEWELGDSIYDMPRGFEDFDNSKKMTIDLVKKHPKFFQEIMTDYMDSPGFEYDFGRDVVYEDAEDVFRASTREYIKIIQRM